MATFKAVIWPVIAIGCAVGVASSLVEQIFLTRPQQFGEVYRVTLAQPIQDVGAVVIFAGTSRATPSSSQACNIAAKTAKFIVDTEEARLSEV